MKKARVRAELLLLIQHEDAQNQSGMRAVSDGTIRAPNVANQCNNRFFEQKWISSIQR
jgi:hypothetical protein